jgi:hypothetical protein
VLVVSRDRDLAAAAIEEFLALVPNTRVLENVLAWEDPEDDPVPPPGFRWMSPEERASVSWTSALEAQLEDADMPDEMEEDAP